MSDIEIMTRYEELEGLRSVWNEQAATHLRSLYMTFEWVTSLWESHLDRKNASFVIARDGATLRGIFPLTHHVIKKHHVPFHQYGLVTNNYGRNHNGLIIFGDHLPGLEALFEHLDEEPWDVMQVGSVADDSGTLAWLKEYERHGRYRLVLEPYVASPYLRLGESWEDYLRTQSSNFRSDMKRKWNKAMSRRTEFTVVTRPEEVTRALEEIYAIEMNSWKEGTSTSITTQPLAQKFYEIFLPKAAENGWLYLVLLRMDGEPVAYDMGILYADTYYMLKTSYDQRAKDWSPGLVLRQFVMQELYKRHVREHDFLGDDEPWKMRWTQTVRKHWNAYLYNRKRVRANLYARVRQLVKQD